MKVFREKLRKVKDNIEAGPDKVFVLTWNQPYKMCSSHTLYEMEAHKSFALKKDAEDYADCLKEACKIIGITYGIHIEIMKN
jgi:hypothetical protein